MKTKPIKHLLTGRVTGGSWLRSHSRANVGVYLTSGSGSSISMSDRNAKENFAAVNGRAVLDKVPALPLSPWRCKGLASDVRPIGPMAQDSHAAFAVGETDTGRTTVDSDGVALAAIQGLKQKFQEELNRRDAENAELRPRLEVLEKTIRNYQSN